MFLKKKTPSAVGFIDIESFLFFLQPASSTNALPVQLDSQGRVKYDALVKQGHRKDKVILIFHLIHVHQWLNIHCTLF